MTLGRLTARLAAAEPQLVENLVLYAHVTSTNAVARHVVESLPRGLSLPPTLVLALEQSAGRGRNGRTWLSPPGAGMYTSLIWPLEDRSSIGRMPLAVAVGLCDAMRFLGARDCRVKWPNDLVVGTNKLGGILIEVLGPTAGPVHAVVGCGINLAIEHETLDALAATSLEREAGVVPDLAEVVVRCVRAVEGELRRTDDRSALVARYRELVIHRPGDRLLWRQGQEVVEGRYRGIDAAGCLELETESGSRVVNAGEIVIQ